MAGRLKRELGTFIYHSSIPKESWISFWGQHLVLHSQQIAAMKWLGGMGSIQYSKNTMIHRQQGTPHRILHPEEEVPRKMRTRVERQIQKYTVCKMIVLLAYSNADHLNHTQRIHPEYAPRYYQ